MADHDWYCVGGAAGWEVWECTRCHRWCFPNIFGRLWPDVLQHVFKRFRCTPTGSEQ